MSTFYVKNDQIIDNKIQITGDDFYHLKNVLRYKIGETIDICDENSVKYKTRIEKYIDKIAVCCIECIYENTTEPNINVTLYQGFPKADKLEMIIQKTTEIGVMDIFPVQMERSIVKMDKKNIEKKVERWNKICAEASKQSGRQKIPRVHMPINFKNMIENISKYDIVLLPYENEKSVTLKSKIMTLNNTENKGNFKEIAIIIGPEGGFSKEEINTLSKFENVHIVSLGPRILRTETAALVTLSMLIYEFEL